MVVRNPVFFNGVYLRVFVNHWAVNRCGTFFHCPTLRSDCHPLFNSMFEELAEFLGIWLVWRDYARVLWSRGVAHTPQLVPYLVSIRILFCNAPLKQIVRMEGCRQVKLELSCGVLPRNGESNNATRI